ncbi:MAG: EthD domain-containing protein [Janthinobacterium lividum]
MFLTILAIAGNGSGKHAELKGQLRGLLGDLQNVESVHVNRVVRHIPTDSMSDDKAPTDVLPNVGDIDYILEVYLKGAPATASVRRRTVTNIEKLLPDGKLMFWLDAEPNIPIALHNGAQKGGFKRVMLLGRAAADQATFRSDWFGRHADFVKKMPHVDGYTQQLVTERYGADGAEVSREQLPIDGLAGLCFADEAAMQKAYSSEERIPLKEDGRTLLRLNSTMQIDATVVQRLDDY